MGYFGQQFRTCLIGEVAQASEYPFFLGVGTGAHENGVGVMVRFDQEELA